MSVLQLTRQAIKGVSTTDSIARNPLNFALDTIIRFIVKVLIPVPVAQELIIYFKGPILALLCGVILFFITLLFLITTILFTPLSILSPLVNVLAQGQNLQTILKELDGYNEEGFTDT